MVRTSAWDCSSPRSLTSLTSELNPSSDSDIMEYQAHVVDRSGAASGLASLQAPAPLARARSLKSTNNTSRAACPQANELAIVRHSWARSQCDPKALDIIMDAVGQLPRCNRRGPIEAAARRGPIAPFWGLPRCIRRGPIEGLRPRSVARSRRTGIRAVTGAASGVLRPGRLASEACGQLSGRRAGPGASIRCVHPRPGRVALPEA